jgi:peptidoglycan/LPS O-acetylase OafA/YrhL
MPQVKSFSSMAVAAAPALSPQQRHQHLPVLDGVRGIAILLVILHHLARSIQLEFGVTSPVLDWLQIGWSGVDLFFVLSGFLITGILYDSKSSLFYLRNFYMRRVLRIFPLYFGVLAAVTVAGKLSSGVAAWGGTESQIWLWTYLTNIQIARNGWGAFGFLNHFWSLAVEEHFYIVWPFLVLWLDRKTLMRLSLCLCGCALALRTCLVLGGASEATVYVLTPCRVDALALGGCIALAVRGNGSILALVPLARSIGAGALVLLCAIAFWRGGLTHEDAVVQTAGLSLLAVVFGSMLILCIQARNNGLLSSILCHKSAGLLGKLSYGLYVLHPPIFIVFFHTHIGRSLRIGEGLVTVISTAIMAVAVTAIVTGVSWICWETRFLRLKRFYE